MLAVHPPHEHPHRPLRARHRPLRHVHRVLPQVQDVGGHGGCLRPGAAPLLVCADGRGRVGAGRTHHRLVVHDRPPPPHRLRPRRAAPQVQHLGQPPRGPLLRDGLLPDRPRPDADASHHRRQGRPHLLRVGRRGEGGDEDPLGWRRPSHLQSRARRCQGLERLRGAAMCCWPGGSAGPQETRRAFPTCARLFMLMGAGAAAALAGLRILAAAYAQGCQARTLNGWGGSR
mmetsp:Transcript_16195/g.38519  ORF Transcript_16195/g.38519 Transcript_16195/m.38519 type:complete len:230 (-) Transcript_16195:149-838(-)